MRKKKKFYKRLRTSISFRKKKLGLLIWRSKIQKTVLRINLGKKWVSIVISVIIFVFVVISLFVIDDNEKETQMK